LVFWEANLPKRELAFLFLSKVEFTERTLLAGRRCVVFVSA
jgi:hypothetical protein